MIRRFIIDTDTGSDDAWAIVEALCAEDIARVEAITTVCGNFPLDLCTKNALLAEDAAGGYLPPVYRGVAPPLLSQPSAPWLVPLTRLPCTDSSFWVSATR